MREQAERMLNLFRGFEGAHGTYRQEDRTSGKVKVEIKKTAKTVREPATAELWEKHLRGERPLGIVPITMEGLCWWGVIDVDMYEISHKDVVDKLQKMGIPLLVCRSKSGGAHLFAFLKEPIPASDIINKLREVAASLGYGGSEIFPKQTEILLDRGDLGNWLNMPYFEAEGGTRYCIAPGGKGVSLDKFLIAAESARMSPEDFMSLRPSVAANADQDLDQGPPCLQHLGSVGVNEGGRNNALFAFGVLAKKKFPDEWEQKLESWNQKFISPPLPTDELQLVIRSLRRKDYMYACKDQPIASHCDAQTCKQRRFGVDAGGALPSLSSISILDTQPPLFFVCLSDGGTVECSADDILSPRSFQLAALTQLRVLLPLYKNSDWLNSVQKCLDAATVIEAPKEASIEGTFRDILEQFLTDRHRAQSRDEILLGKPYLEEEEMVFMFRLRDLMDFLERSRFRDYSRPKTITAIRELGGDHKFFNLRGKGTNLWMIRADRFSVQTQPHTAPEGVGSPI